MAGRLEGKVALITGTAGGQGRAAALLFTSEGARVVGCDVDAVGSDATVALVEAAGGSMVSVHPCDLTVEDEVKHWVESAVDTYGDFDILYNNAAARRAGSFEDMSLEDWNWTLDHDLTLVFLTIKHALPVFKRKGRGAIINTASVAGMNITRPGNARGSVAHPVAKAAVIRLTELLAIELGPHKIRVNAVSPGCILTPALAPLVGDPQARALFEQMSVLDQLGAPEDIALAALYLASDEASFVTGVNLNVDGGSSVSGGMGAPDSRVERVIEDAVRRWAAQPQVDGRPT